MSASTVLVETRGSVAVLTLNRPDAANTLNLRMACDLLAAALVCERNHEIRAVVLTGAGRQFCFGGDLRGMINEGGAIDAYLRELTMHLHSAIALFMRMDAPVIAAVNGTAAGAGVGLVAMADLAVAARGAKFSLAYTGVGLSPDAGTSFLLPRAVGAKRAMELVLTNRTLTADEALDWGLVNRVADDAQLLDEAITLAEQLAAGPRRSLGQAKRLVGAALGALESHMALESRAIAGLGAGSEGQEGIHAFLEKRKPRYPC
ncbi:MAG: enoyl-CoA hydratase/isomerase family protein [Gammaproteobacteria bacterium]|nr:enoyl-CoA hydratase/isomerase family protein [Gammaproteobacteria bacterium]